MAKIGTAHYSSVFLVLVLGGIWGLDFSIIKMVSESGLGYSNIMAVTILGVCLALLVISVVRKKLPDFTVASIRFYILCALLGYVVPFLSELYFANILSAGSLSLIVSTTPIFTMVIASLSKRSAKNYKLLIKPLLGAMCFFVLLLPDTFSSQSFLSFALILALIIPITYGLYHNYVSVAWPRELDTWQVATGEAFAALFILAPVYFWFGDSHELHSLVTLEQWGEGEWGILIMVIIAVVEVYLYLEVVQASGAVFVSQASYVAIISGMLWGMVLLNESSSIWMWLGVIVMCITLYVSASDTEKFSIQA